MSRETRSFGGSLLAPKLRIAVGSIGLDRWSASETFKVKGEASGGDRLERAAVQLIAQDKRPQGDIMEKVKDAESVRLISLLTAANKRISKLEEWLEWIAAHNVLETEIPTEGFYINMSPNEGAAAALRGTNIREYS